MLNRILLVIVMCCSTTLAIGQQDRYYVVVGAFAKIRNAERFTRMVQVADHPAQFALHTGRKLHYVFVLSTPNKQEAFNLAIKLRVESPYKDAWVHKGNLGEVVEVKPEPVKQEPEPVKPEVKPEEKPVEPVTVVQPEPKDSVMTPVVKQDSVVKPVVKPSGKPFLFRLLSPSGKEVEGEVQLVESRKSSQYQAFEANKLVYVPAPRNTDGSFQLTVAAPGYKSLTVLIDYKNPEPSSSGKGPDDEFIIPLNLQTATVGDYIEFNRVGFFKNTSILTPESQPELDGLINLMKENEKYRIVIHAHCNGKQDRDVTVMGGSKNYFGLDPANEKRKSVSAKDLTMFRAISVKSYFMTMGIAESRIKLVSEGGNAMIYPPTSTVSGRNDRIEIEVKKR